MEPHRKRVKHYNVGGHAHLLTFSCYRRMPLLTNSQWQGWFSETLNSALARHPFQLVAFVYMPEHVHLLVWPTCECYDISRLLWAIKRPFSYRVGKHLAAIASPLTQQLTLRTRPGVQSFRFWQEGGGHDRNLISPENCIKAAEYIHHNPVRRRLVQSPDQWRFSSWTHYHRPHNADDPALPIVHGFPS